jgi:hypothetical protein
MSGNTCYRLFPYAQAFDVGRLTTLQQFYRIHVILHHSQKFKLHQHSASQNAANFQGHY